MVNKVIIFYCAKLIVRVSYVFVFFDTFTKIELSLNNAVKRYQMPTNKQNRVLFISHCYNLLFQVLLLAPHF